MSFFAELRRRNVFRVGVAYAVGAWLLLQFTEVMTELLSLPPTVGPIVVAVVAIGLPVALFLAWAYELTPQGIKRESEVDRSKSIASRTGKKLNGLITTLLALAVVVLLIDKFILRDQAGNSSAPDPAITQAENAAVEAPDEAPQPPAISPRSIAVLPFTNRSPMADDEFFIDGIHDDLLTNLARIGELKVISRTSVMRFKDTELPIPDIASTLGVATIMEGAVQRAGDMVRINVQLIDANTDEHLWAQIYDRELTTRNLFEIQSEIAGHIAEALQAQLSPAEVEQLERLPTENLAAYSAYLRGMRAFERREIGSMQEALAEFQRAVALDPEFAHAWAGITQVAVVLPSWGGMPIDDALAIAEPAAQQALALAPGLGEANLAMAMVLLRQGALTEMEARFQLAIEMLPNSAAAHQWYANSIQDDPQRYAEAAALLRKAAELDPLAPIYRHQIARHAFFAGRFVEAEAELLGLLEVDPEFFPALSFMSLTVTGLGRWDESLMWSRRAREADPGSPFPIFSDIFSLMTLRDEQRLQRLVSTLQEEDSAPNPALMGVAQMGLAMTQGRPAAALEVLSNMRSIQGLFEPGQFRVRLLIYMRNYDAAREELERQFPGFFDREAFADQIAESPGSACLSAFVLLKTGSVDLGEELLNTSMAFIDGELPSRVSDWEQFGKRAHCQAISGDYEEALATLERVFASKNYFEWWEPRELEYFEPLHGDPRFERLMQGVADEMARQRKQLDIWDAEGTES